MKTILLVEDVWHKDSIEMISYRHGDEIILKNSGDGRVLIHVF